MFKKQKNDSLQGDQKAGSINIVGVGTEIVGDLSTKGDIRIDGKITGTVISKAKVVIGTTGEVIGNIFSESAEISGIITGDVSSLELLFLKVTANIKGDIIANKLIVENGANITGHCQTGISQTKSILKPQLDGREEIIEKREATA
ncbi:MAG: polymer-forming cytoskeletal protein [Bacteroidetes bacterium]|nr:polymer-forming cytoskeletal protein [Bacteroidota bacterium]MBU1372385.1 polymer-forming cytoskeletal protein [Bacteroidota bacterium]MBU1483409.1 polymer-forming cytoskeletal protein [Bacteroidota bacterium]MBU1760208.1 polymer-forming cytoskeletal protein [Bacteroidota bacterium]MBU2267346.1 polymer-forming cytoskeletal protein [Bacteroidota bacterium]